jgi:hypothetical protein
MILENLKIDSAARLKLNGRKSRQCFERRRNAVDFYFGVIVDYRRYFVVKDKEIARGFIFRRFRAELRGSC